MIKLSVDRRQLPMTIYLDPDLDSALRELAQRRGTSAEALVNEALRERFLSRSSTVQPRDDWERRLFGLGVDCGTSLSDVAVSSEGLYD
jgi:hypothetical protein